MASQESCAAGMRPLRTLEVPAMTGGFSKKVKLIGGISVYPYVPNN
jgi:hypothetical protein